MSARSVVVALALAAAAIGWAAHEPSTPVVTAAEQNGTTTLDDQVELALTVYNSDIALVRDVRNLQLARGTSDLHFMDIAATVNPATVHFRSLTEPSRVSVLEQNYEYDLLDPDKLLRKYVGRDLTLIRNRQESGSTRQEEVKAHLLSYNTAPVWKIGNEIVTGIGADHIRFPELPSTLYSRPTLIWTFDNGGGARHRVEASYLAGKMAWNADYVLTVARDDKSADVDGWVTLTNGSGTSFRNASLQLVAGDLNRVRQVVGKMLADEFRAERNAAAAPMAQESFSDYHLYTLGRKTTINNAETKQVSMLGGTAVPVQKRYVVEGQAFYYHNAGHPGAPIKDVVQVFYQFKNEEKSGLGMPMPAGVVRVYQADSTRRRAVRRGRPHRSHTERRDAQSEDWECLRRRMRAQPGGLREDRGFDLRGRVPDHAAQPQDHAGSRGSKRANWWDVADDPFLARVDEDGGVGGAVQRAGGGGRRSRAEVSRPGHLLMKSTVASINSVPARSS